MSAPRVLVLGAVLGQPQGGVRRHNAELLPRAARLLGEGGGGLAVLCGATPPGFELPEPVEELRTDVPAAPPLRRARAEGRAVRAALRDAAAAGRPFDVVHTAHLPLPRAAALRPAALTVTLHDLRQLDRRLVGPLRAALARFAYRAVARRAARVVFVSRTVRDAFVARYPEVAPRVCVVPNAGDHLRVAPRGAPVRGYFAPGYLLHVGHLEPRKNLGLALRALAVDPELPPLVLVGASRDGERARLDALARTLGVAGRVYFLGAVDDGELPSLYASAGCLLVPSLLEGFCIPVHEALRAGLPVAVSRAGALPEVAGPAAPTFAPDDPADLVRAARAALAGPAPVGLDLPGWDASARSLVDAWRAAAAERG